MPKKNMQLKAYMFYQYEPGEEAYLIFALTSKGAKSLGLRDHLLEDYQSDCYTDVKADRLKRADSLVRDGAEKPYREDSEEVLRKAHWSCDGDLRCDKCELATWGGKFPLCEECGQCEECGHEAGCENA